MMSFARFMWIWVCVVCLFTGLSACSDAGQGAQKDADQKPVVVTSFTVLADMARVVAGEDADVRSVTKPGAEVHNYDPTPQDIVGVQDADLILWNGLNLERWFERFLAELGTVRSVVVSQGIEPLSIYEGEYTGKPNPHAWMSVENAVIYVHNIRDALIELDPSHRDGYAARAENYVRELRQLKAELQERLQRVPPHKRVLVTSEGAFSYLARDMGFQELYLWPMNADQQGTPQQVRRVVDLVREKSIPVVFSESTISPKPAQQVARETGALYGGVLYVDSLSGSDGPVPTFLDLLKVTTNTIVRGFEAGLAQQGERYE